MLRTCIVLSIAGMLSFGQAVSAEQPNDQEIIFAIETELLVDEQVSAHLIDVNCIDGIATLSGRVNNILSKERAERLTGTVKGVRSVVNQIEVRPVEKTDPELKQDIQRSLLQDPATDSYEIQSSVENGEVTLQGNVHSYQEKELAEQVVKSVAGVRAVKNLIAVDYRSESSDFEIKEDVESRLRNDMWIDEALIDVKVNNGRVILSGTVGSGREKRRAISDAWVMGTNAVKAEALKVQWWADDDIQKEVTPMPPKDEEINKAIEDAFFYDPRVSSFNINIGVENGQVLLSGVVDNLQAKKAAANDAKNTLGVWDVRNHIRVRPESIPDDKELQKQVKDALLRDSYVELYDIAVSVLNGQVFLSGQVNTSFEKKRAESVASTVNGVVDVVNNIDYQHQWTWKSDWMIKKDIKSQFYWSPVVESDDIQVAVENGVVTLTGKVETWNERRAAERNAYEGGAKDVHNRLKIENWSPYSDFYPHSF